ncbi:MAG: hypothetical protein ACXVAN_18495, partial [Polyangia bacterium]
MRPLFLVALTLTALPAAAATTATIKYVVTMAERVAGSQPLPVGADGTREYDFEFNDRGRGPKLHSRIRLAADGTIASLDTTGNDYIKAAVADRFHIEGGRARWDNGVEHGDVAGGRAFYVSYYGVPDENALLAAALLRAPDHSLPLLPAGRARIEEVARKVVTAGAEKRTVVEYALSGLDFTPSTVWLDTDGTLFASGNSWLMTIRD